MEAITHFTPLLVVMVLAALVPLVLSRFKYVSVPLVVGEIIVGIIVGRSGLGLVVRDDPLLDFLAEFGLVFLMFLSGMEIDFSSFRSSNSGLKDKKQRRTGPVTIGMISFGITLLISIGLGFVLLNMDLVKDPWMMALILSTTSLGVVVPVLKESGLISGRYGQTLLIAALIADFATMLLITIEVAILSKGLTLDVLLIALLFLAALAAYRAFNFIFNKIPGLRRIMEELNHATAQIKTRLALATMLIFVVLAGFLGTEVILGSFLAGVTVALLLTKADSNVIHQLETIGYGFLIPIFFVKVGANLNFGLLFESSQAMLLVPLLLVAAFLVKFVASLAFRLSFTMKETLAAGLLLSSRLSLIIAAVAIGVRLGVISEAVEAAVVLVAIITVTISPTLFNRIIPRKSHRSAEHLMMIAGSGELGMQVASGLRAHHEKIVILDNDMDRINRAVEQGYEAIFTDYEQIDARAAGYLQQADTLICIHSDILLNYKICQAAKENFGIDNIVAYVREPQNLPKYEALGVNTINAAVDRVALVVLLARSPSAYNLMTRTDDNKEVQEVYVEDGFCTGKKIRDLNLPGDVLVMALRRNGDLIVPHSGTKIERGDNVTLVGSLDWMQEARLMFAGECMDA
ncbi:MAG: cation:proton antiporter [Anaerolineaceae bacterium]|nr:cation:proton antiporter [Anaerolineaceae bacterium]